MLLKIEQPTAGQLPWSDGGLILLQTIRNSLYGNADKELTNKHDCNKKDCAYCYEVGRDTKATFMAPVSWEQWQEDWLIKNYSSYNINISIQKLGKSKSAIANKVTELRIKGHDIDRKSRSDKYQQRFGKQTHNKGSVSDY